MRKKEKDLERSARFVSFSELYQAVSNLRELDEVFTLKGAYLDQKIEKLQAEKQKQETQIREKLKKKFKCQEILNEQEPNLKNPPSELRNAIAVALFFIDKEYESFSNIFLPKIFSYFPEAETMLLSAPTRVKEQKFLRNFLITKGKIDFQPCNVLYAFHKIQLLTPFLRLEKSFEMKKSAKCEITQNTRIMTEIRFDVVLAPDQNSSAKVGSITVLRGIDPLFIKNNYNLLDLVTEDRFVQNETIFIAEQNVSPLLYHVKNWLVREVLRLTGAYFAVSLAETNLNQQGVTLGPYKLDKFIRRHQRELPHIQIYTPRLVAQEKVKINHRIVVVGASNCALSFLHFLAENQNFDFQSLTLISAHFPWIASPFRATTSDFFFDPSELLRKSFDRKVQLVSGRVKCLDRKSRTVRGISCSGSEFDIEFDILILAVGLEEKTNEMTPGGGLLPCDRLTEKVSILASAKEKELKDLKHILGSPEELFLLAKRTRGWLYTLLHPKIPKNTVVFGSSINAFILLSDLLTRFHIDPTHVVLVLPREYEEDESAQKENIIDSLEKEVENPLAFGEKIIFEHFISLLEKKGVTVFRQHTIHNYSPATKMLTLRNTKIVEKHTGTLGKKKLEQDPADPLVNFENVLLFSAETFDVPQDIYNTAQENGLVFNGRLIVQSDFTTIDESIFAAGRSCEFSQRYKNLAGGRPLKMDQLNQFELGISLGQSLIKKLEGDDEKEPPVPSFVRPTGEFCELFQDFKFINMRFPYRGAIDGDRQLKKRISNFLNAPQEEFF